MFRKIMIAAVLSLGFLAPLAIPALSEAREVVVVRHARPAYQVYYRGCNRDCWQVNGYRHRRDAVRAVHSYHRRGYEGRIR